MVAQIAQVDSESDDLARRLQELLRQQEEKQREKAELERSVRRVEQQLEEQLRRREAMVAELSRARDIDAGTARRHLEEASWDLQRALDSIMPEIPDSPVAGSSFDKTHFKPVYLTTEAPDGPLELGMALGELLKGHCEDEGIDWRGEGQPYLKRLQTQTMQNMDDPIDVMMQRMWTSELTLRGLEFCSILNRAIFADPPGRAQATAALSRGINKLCVHVPPSPPFPPGDVCLRGGGFDDRYRSFFAKGRKYRQPAYVATSFSEPVARRFLRMRGGTNCVLWRVRIDSVQKCVHVNLVQATHVAGEEEYLFAPYSTFTVLSAAWNAGTPEAPHEIELLAAVDNKAEPEDLPLAPWS